jgi:NADH-quinone oxidoreductase subunit J
LPVVLGFAAIYPLLPQARRSRPVWAGALAVLALVLGGAILVHTDAYPVESLLFYCFAGGAIGAGVMMITQKNPVHAALSFALVVLSSCGLFLLQAAPFLMAATIIVYAGAIVVTFLFVIMLAQPEGHSAYDRISWGWFPKTFSVLAAATLVALLTFLLGNLRGEAAKPLTTETAKASTDNLTADGSLLDQRHMANLGRHLFSEHLISVEVAGTLLLVALVGAVAIAIQGKPRLATRIEEALR